MACCSVGLLLGIQFVEIAGDDLLDRLVAQRRGGSVGADGDSARAFSSIEPLTQFLHLLGLLLNLLPLLLEDKTQLDLIIAGLAETCRSQHGSARANPVFAQPKYPISKHGNDPPCHGVGQAFSLPLKYPGRLKACPTSIMVWQPAALTAAFLAAHTTRNRAKVTFCLSQGLVSAFREKWIYEESVANERKGEGEALSGEPDGVGETMLLRQPA